MLGLLLVPAAILGAAAVVLGIAWYAGLLESFILRRSNMWYGTMVQRLPLKSRLLDIGSGIVGVKTLSEMYCGVNLDTLTGTVRIAETMEVQVVGLQENNEKFKQAYQTLMRAGLKNKVVLHSKSIYDPSLQAVFGGEARFNTVVFSTPLMSLRDPVAALRVATSLLKEGGVVYIPQVLNYSGISGFHQILSPFFRLLHIAPIAEVMKVVLEADMEVQDDLPASGVDVDGQKPQAARLLVLRRTQGTTSDLKKDSPVAESDGHVRSRKGAGSKK